MQKILIFSALFLLFNAANAQKYKRTTPEYDFSFAKDGKMKVMVKGEVTMFNKGPKEITGTNQIVLQFDKWAGVCTPVVDGKIGDSLAGKIYYAGLYLRQVVFMKKGDQLLVSESIIENSTARMTTDPDTGEEVEELDEYGYPMYDVSYSGGHFELVNLKDGKSAVKKTGEYLTNFFGDRVLSCTRIPAEDTYYDTYSLRDWKGTVLFEGKILEEIYEDDAMVSLLVNQPKADKVLFRNYMGFADHFAYTVNGKMGYSSLRRGVLAEPNYEFCYANSETEFYIENGLLKMKTGGKTYEAKKSIQSYTDMMQYYTQWYFDGKIFQMNPDDEYSDFSYMGDYVPSYGGSQTFIKVGDLIFYSMPYYAPEMMYDGGETYLPNEADLGYLLIYNTQTKEIIFNFYANSLMTFTDKGILIRQIEVDLDEENFGQLNYYYSIIDLNGNIIHENISQENYTADGKYALSLLPADAKEIAFSNSYSGASLIYLLNDKVGVFSEYNIYSIEPNNRWYLNSRYDNVIFTNDKIMDNTDTVPYTGNVPYALKDFSHNTKAYWLKGNSRTLTMNYGTPVETKEKITAALTDTSCAFYSVEFKDNLVIQNASESVTVVEALDYDPETFEPMGRYFDDGEPVFNYTYTAKSGVFDRKKGVWIVDPTQYRVMVQGKYIFASYFSFDQQDIHKNEFNNITSKPQYQVYDLSGTLIIKGTAAEVKKKTGVDPSKIVISY